MFVCFSSCGKKEEQTGFKISVIDSAHIRFSNFNHDIFTDLKQDTLNSEAWLKLLPVYRMPADTGMKDFQQPQPGKYQLKDSVILFSPDTPFRYQQVYFARFYQYQDNSNGWSLVKDRWKQHKPRYAERVFKVK